ncbi:LysR family transcriptional regulator [Cellvibrio sp. pealriver]|uniref:LysR family transcriptional regulator n=1 Tax=Cellvibrio sp. pealriver TaxID=1622269 RepID=UPI00066FD4A6|nr:LysR family transcriptional regulator [Cellvibrio sp. pealriver]
MTQETNLSTAVAITENKVTLEQWRALLAVIDAGGYAKAAELLNKSQSAVSYAISQLETALDVKVFHLQGRKAVATPAGELLYRRAKQLLEQAVRLEKSAACLSVHVEPLVKIAADIIIPPIFILQCLEIFAKDFPDTRVEIFESVLSGTEDALLQRQVDLAIGGRVPPGFMGEKLVTVIMHGVASPGHPLLQLGRPVNHEDMRQHRQIIVRDSGQYRRRTEGWQEADQRWTVSHIKTSIDAIRMGLGYAWLPDAYTYDDIAAGRLKYLPVEVGSVREVTTYLTFADRDFAGPATRHLAEVLKEHLPKMCSYS